MRWIISEMKLNHTLYKWNKNHSAIFSFFFVIVICREHFQIAACAFKGKLKCCWLREFFFFFLFLNLQTISLKIIFFYIFCYNNFGWHFISFHIFPVDRQKAMKKMYMKSNDFKIKFIVFFCSKIFMLVVFLQHLHCFFEIFVFLIHI